MRFDHLGDRLRSEMVLSESAQIARLEAQVSKLGSLTLIRHSETDWNKVGKLNSRTDLALSGEGRLKAKQLSSSYQAFLPKEAILFSSPLKRAQETTELLFPDQIFSIDDRLVELDFGIFEGKSPDEARSSDNAHLFGIWRNTGASSLEDQTESLSSAISRAIEFFEAHDLNHKDVTLVSHGVFLRVVISSLFAATPNRYRAFVLDNCHFAQIKREGGLLRLSKLNCLP